MKDNGDDTYIPETSDFIKVIMLWVPKYNVINLDLYFRKQIEVSTFVYKTNSLK